MNKLVFFRLFETENPETFLKLHDLLKSLHSFHAISIDGTYLARNKGSAVECRSGELIPGNEKKKSISVSVRLKKSCSHNYMFK